MANISFDFNNVVGKIKPTYTVEQPSFLSRKEFPRFEYLKKAHLPYFHPYDVGGSCSEFVCVDIRNFDLDETLPESYDFTFADHLITALAENNCELTFCPGVTIESQAEHKAYRVHPSKDLAKWEYICYTICCREVWNEIECFNSSRPPMWKETREQFCEIFSQAG